MSSLARNTALFSGLTMASRLSGLLRVMAFNAILGSGRIDRLADSYNLANTIPNILYEFIVGGLLTAIFVPVLVHEQERHGKSSAEAWRAANLLLGTVGLLLAVVSIIAIVLSPQVVWALTFLSSKGQASKDLAAYLLQFFAPQMFFYGLSAVFMAILNSHNVFAITAAAPILNNFIMLATLFAYKMGAIGISGLGMGTTAGIAAMALIQIPWLLKIGMPIRPLFNFRDKLLIAVGGLGGPIIALAIANLAATAVRTNLLYSIAGAYTAFVNCFMLVMMPYGIFAVSIATVMYPAMSRSAAANNMVEMRETFSRGFRWTAMITIPISLGMSVLALPIARVLFERGKFGYADSMFNGSFLRYYALSILPYSLLMFTTRGFYSLKDTITPTSINAVGVVLLTALNFALAALMGANGIALATVITYVFTGTVSLYYLRKKLGRLDGQVMFQSCSKFAIAGVIMAAILVPLVWWTNPDTVVLQKGRHFPALLTESGIRGSSIVINSEEEWKKYWDLLVPEDDVSPPPQVNFKKNSVVAITGPITPTTCTLALKNVTVSGSEAKANLMINKVEEGDANGPLIHPPYMLLLVHPPVGQANVQFEVAATSQASGVKSLFHNRELVRLPLFVILGAVIYGGLCWLMGAGEVKAFSAMLSRRIGARFGTRNEQTDSAD